MYDVSTLVPPDECLHGSTKRSGGSFLTKRSSGVTNDFTQMHRIAVATRNHRAMVEYVENSGRFAPGTNSDAQCCTERNGEYAFSRRTLAVRTVASPQSNPPESLDFETR